MDSGKAAISVVVPTKNAEGRISRCLNSILNQSYPPAEVVVVDGNSIDRTVELAQRYHVKICHEDYGTVGGARQTGLENTMGEFVAFTDDDTIPDGDWLKNLVKEFDANIVGVGGGVKYVGNNLWGKSAALCMNSVVGSGNSVQGRLFKEKKWVKSISGCNSMYRRKTLMEIGGFNVRLSVNEETELNKRMCKKGKLLYTPDAIVLHNQDRGLKDFAIRMHQFGYGRGKLRLWALPCVFPIAFLLLLLSLTVTIWALVIAASAYAVILIFMAFKFAIWERQAKYLVSIPIVYVVEHFSYSIGFWRGLLRR
jgi:glycosyltransferase involved in cell wall biosynthesis